MEKKRHDNGIDDGNGKIFARIHEAEKCKRIYITSSRSATVTPNKCDGGVTHNDDWVVKGGGGGERVKYTKE